jgi:hypothetical protein
VYADIFDTGDFLYRRYNPIGDILNFLIHASSDQGMAIQLAIVPRSKDTASPYGLLPLPGAGYTRFECFDWGATGTL